MRKQIIKIWVVVLIFFSSIGIISAFWSSSLVINTSDEHSEIIIGQARDVTTEINLLMDKLHYPLVPTGMALSGYTIDEVLLDFYIVWIEENNTNYAQGTKGIVEISNIRVFVDDPLISTNYFNYEIINYPTTIFLNQDMIESSLGFKYNTLFSLKITMDEPNSFDDYQLLINQPITVRFIVSIK